MRKLDFVHIVFMWKANYPFRFKNSELLHTNAIVKQIRTSDVVNALPIIISDPVHVHVTAYS